jgi:YidC/Oxa1 family membrane protein insertase
MMKNLRTYLWAALGLALLVNYQTWMVDYTAKDAVAAETKARVEEAAKVAAPLGAAIPGAAIPAAVASTVAAADVPATTATPQVNALIRVRTDVLDVDIGMRGGDLLRGDLLTYPQVKGLPTPVRLLRSNGRGDQYVIQTGLAGAGTAPTGEFPTHLAQYSSDFTEYVLQPGMTELKVPLTWRSAEGVVVTKTFIFRRGGFRIDAEYAVQNGSAAPWSVASYAQILHDLPKVETSYINVNSYSFTGPALYDGKKYEKLKTADKEDANLSRDISNGWIASLQHHFVTAISPAADQLRHYTLRARDNEYLATSVGPTVSVAPGAAVTLKETLYVGPKLQAQLEAIHPELGRAADFGFLTFLSKPLFWLLDKAHKIFGNWGVAIIAVTMLLKLALYPLSETSGRSMAKMRLVAPRLKQLQETYKDDREKLARATMEIYKKEKVNPASGCLPMLIQMPVFLAFYWVLLESAEMRQAPFMGWLQDISAADPYYILPVLLAGATFIQFKLQPAPPDPVQAKVMMFMPIAMSVLFVFLPAGLVLYYLVNTILTMGQQWLINKRIESEATARN